MTDPRFSHPDFGTREEDWPDPDIDSDTEEGREAMARLEAASLACIDRQIARRNRQPTYPDIPEALYDKARNHQDLLTDEERRLLLTRGDLVGKVLAYPDSLTEDEIHEFMHWPPPDVVRANIQRATGGTLSTPTELHAKGKDAIDRGQLTTMLTEEEMVLLSRQFHAMDSKTYCIGAAMAALRVKGIGAALDLMCRRLGLSIALICQCASHVIDQSRRSRILSGPPNGLPSVNEIIRRIYSLIAQHERGEISDQEAVTLHWRCLGSLRTAFTYQPVQGAALEEMITSISSLRRPRFLDNITDQEVLTRIGEYVASYWAASNPSVPPPIPVFVPAPLQSDRFGSGPWPTTSQPKSPIGIFQSTTNLSDGDLAPAWYDLSEDQREAYRAQYETARRAAWVVHETEQAEQSARWIPPPPRDESQPDLRYPYNLDVPGAPRERLPGLRESPNLIGELQVFRDEIGQEVEFEEVLARWEVLTDEQKGEYTAKAKVLNDTAQAEYEVTRQKYFNTNF